MTDKTLIRSSLKKPVPSSGKKVPGLGEFTNSNKNGPKKEIGIQGSMNLSPKQSPKNPTMFSRVNKPADNKPLNEKKSHLSEGYYESLAEKRIKDRFRDKSPESSEELKSHQYYEEKGQQDLPKSQLEDLLDEFHSFEMKSELDKLDMLRKSALSASSELEKTSFQGKDPSYKPSISHQPRHSNQTPTKRFMYQPSSPDHNSTNFFLSSANKSSKSRNSPSMSIPNPRKSSNQEQSDIYTQVKESPPPSADKNYQNKKNQFILELGKRHKEKPSYYRHTSPLENRTSPVTGSLSYIPCDTEEARPDTMIVHDTQPDLESKIVQPPQNQQAQKSLSNKNTGSHLSPTAKIKTISIAVDLKGNQPKENIYNYIDKASKAYNLISPSHRRVHSLQNQSPVTRASVESDKKISPDAVSDGQKHLKKDSATEKISLLEKNAENMNQQLVKMTERAAMLEQEFAILLETVGMLVQEKESLERVNSFPFISLIEISSIHKSKTTKLKCLSYW